LSVEARGCMYSTVLESEKRTDANGIYGHGRTRKWPGGAGPGSVASVSVSPPRSTFLKFLRSNAVW